VLRDGVILFSFRAVMGHPTQVEQFQHGILKQDEGVSLKALDCKTACLAPILASETQSECLGDESAGDGADDRQTATSEEGEDELSCVHRSANAEPMTCQASPRVPLLRQ